MSHKTSTLLQALVAACYLLAGSTPQCLDCTYSPCRPLALHRSPVSVVQLRIVCNASDSDLGDFLANVDAAKIKSVQLRITNSADVDLSRLSNITRLDLSSNGLKDFDPSRLTGVVSLDLSDNVLHALRNVPSHVSAIDLSHNLITTLEDIDYASLVSLNISYNSILEIANFSSPILTSLDVSYNGLERWRFGDCPKLKYLDLSGNNVTAVEIDAFVGLTSLETLDLSYNAIRSLDENAFPAPGLLQLDLRGNSLNRIGHATFRGLNRLRYLDLSDNGLAGLSAGTLQDLPGLVKLDVSGNEDLNRGAPEPGPVLVTGRLQYVAAADTGLTTVPSSLTRSVRSLDLARNHIHSVQCGDMDSYPLLTTLKLDHNQLSYIEDDAFGRLELLSSLILDHNSLKSIPHTLPGNLTSLGLAYNNLHVIYPSDFSGLTRLVSLDLSYNKLVNFSGGLFSKLENLRNLDLSGNPIEVLPAGSLVGLVRLVSLNLSWVSEPGGDAATSYFPLPESDRLQSLSLRGSPSLSQRLLRDAAALRALKRLVYLDLSEDNVTTVGEESLNLLPRLTTIQLDKNPLNCTSIQWLHNYLNRSQIADCYFPVQLEEVAATTTIIPVSTTLATTPKKVTTTSTLSSTLPSASNPTLVDTTTTTTTSTTEYFSLQSTEDVWDNSSSEVGAVYAFSSEVPTSHPGLFVLLLVPVALVSAVLVINYSRLAQARRRLLADTTSFASAQLDSDIEINDLSNDLW